MEVEFLRKAALDCGRRCMMHRPPKPSEVQANPYLANFVMTERDELNPTFEGIRISPGEMVCLNRCISKINNVRELVDYKLIHSPMGGIELDQPPILFN